jgi:hypothetical protein
VLKLIATAERLQKLIASWSTRDIFEAEARGSSHSLFEEQPAERCPRYGDLVPNGH